MQFFGKLSFAGEFVWEGYLALQGDGSLAMSQNYFNKTTDVFLAYAIDAESFVLQASNGRWVQFQGELKGIRSSTGELAKASPFDRQMLARRQLAWTDAGGRFAIYLFGFYSHIWKMETAPWGSGTELGIGRYAPGVAAMQQSGSGAGADFRPVGQARVDLSVADLSGLDLSGANFENTELDGTRFAGSTLDDASFRGYTAAGTDFSGASFLGTDFTGADLTQATFASPPGFSRDPARRTRLEAASIPLATLGRDWLYLDLRRATIVGLEEAHEVANLDARHALLDEVDLAQLSFPEARFDGAVLRKVDLRKTSVVGGAFDGADLTEARLQEADLKTSTLHSAVLVDALLAQCKLVGTRFDPDPAQPGAPPTDLTGADLAFADLTDAELTDAILIRAFLTGAVLYKTRLSGAQLGGQDKSLAASLSYAYLANVQLDRANLYGVSFASATLYGASSSLAETATLEQANFANAYLAGIDFSNALLMGARFDGACLINAVLSGAQLTATRSGSIKASLTGASLEGADFSGANLEGADLANAAVAFDRGEVPVRHCDAAGEPFPPPPDSLPLRHGATVGLDLSSMKENTICPNGHTVRNNLDRGLSLQQMLTSGEAPTSWYPRACRPTAGELEAARQALRRPADS